MSDFGEAVEYAAAPAPKVWRLMVWDVPDRLGGLLSRLGFRPTKKNPDYWWRLFDPAAPADRMFAERGKAEILAAGLKGSWQQVEKRTFAPPPPRSMVDQRSTRTRHKQFHKHVPKPTREGFGGKLNARPINGSWRRKARRR